MEQAIQLFGYLILTFLGIVAPIMAILLSVFNEGILKLTTQYENEKAQSEANIREQMKGKEEAKGLDIAKIEQSLKELKAIKKSAKIKLSFLNPKRVVSRVFILLLISFLGVILSLLSDSNSYICYASVLVSIACFCYALFILWKLLGVVIEVRKTIDEEKRDIYMKTIERDMKTIELLSALVRKESQYFLKNVYIAIDDKKIKDNAGEITMSAYKKQELKIGIINSELRMAKNIEIGFTFPSDFIVEKTAYYSIFTSKTSQVVRYKSSFIHGNTDLKLSPLIITPIKVGEYKIGTFIKAENIETINRDLNLKVTPGWLFSEIFKDMLSKP